MHCTRSRRHCVYAQAGIPNSTSTPLEFGSGFRIVPSHDDSGHLFLDVYLYDTLAGGAGYAELTGRYLNEILRDVLELLENCPAHCDQSCESCLRHYHNQHLRDRLDRFIGAQLLRYAMSGQIPQKSAAAAQANELAGLERLLQLDGLRCTPVTQLEGQTVPLLVERDGQRVVVGTQSALIASNSLSQILGGNRVRGRILNDYILRRSLPGEHQLIRLLFNP